MTSTWAFDLFSSYSADIDDVAEPILSVVASWESENDSLYLLLDGIWTLHLYPNSYSPTTRAQRKLLCLSKALLSDSEYIVQSYKLRAQCPLCEIHAPSCPPHNINNAQRARRSSHGAPLTWPFESRVSTVVLLAGLQRCEPATAPIRPARQKHTADIPRPRRSTSVYCLVTCQEQPRLTTATALQWPRRTSRRPRKINR